MQKNKKQKAMNVAKDILHDRALSAAKDEAISNAITYGAAGTGLAYGIKKELGKQQWKNLSALQKKNVLGKSVLSKGLPALALAGVATDTIVPAIRLRNMHKKELGTNPTVKDYAKLMAVKGLPSAAYYGLMYKNRGKLADGMTDAIKNIPKLVRKSTGMAEKRKAVKAISAGVATGGALHAMDEAVGLAQMIHTPETIVKAKKKGEKKMELKTAFEIVDDVFEKIASESQKNNIVIDKEAEEIVNYGFNKIAANESLLEQ